MAAPDGITGRLVVLTTIGQHRQAVTLHRCTDGRWEPVERRPYRECDR